MKIGEAIRYYEEEAKKCNNRVNEIILGAERCKQEKEKYTQLAEWLRELAERRKQPEIIFCKDCEKHNKRFDEYPADEACPLTVWRVAQEHEFDYQYCTYAERRNS